MTNVCFGMRNNKTGPLKPLHCILNGSSDFEFDEDLALNNWSRLGFLKIE
jgi:hypothetical protein